MPVQPNALVATPIVAFPTTDSNGKTLQGNNRQDKANQPWTLSLGQSTPQTFVHGFGPFPFGFDTILIDTYRAVSNLYSRTIGAISGTYPDSVITLPQFGLYELDFACLFGTASAGGDIQVRVFFLVNGSTVVQTYWPQVASIALNFNSFPLHKTIQCNKGDVLEVFIDQVNNSGVSLATAGGTSGNYLVIRYLGLN